MTQQVSSGMLVSPFRRNRIINGAMMIDQANVGASVTVNSAVVTYSADMFFGFGTGSAGVFTLQQLSASPPAGFKNYLRAAVGTADASPAAGSIYMLEHAIEGNNVVDFAFGTASALGVVVSFWVRSSLNGSFSGSIKNVANNRSYPFSFSITNTNTWEYKSVAIPGDTTGTWAIDNTAGLVLTVDFGCGSTFRGTASTWQAANILGVTSAVRLISTLSATLDITGVQIEPGSVATSFEWRSLTTELSDCYRYFAKTYDLGTKPGFATATSRFTCGQFAASSTPIYNWRYPVAMRVPPTIVGYSYATGTAGKLNDAVGADQNANYDNTGASAVGLYITAGNLTLISGHATADARL